MMELIYLAKNEEHVSSRQHERERTSFNFYRFVLVRSCVDLVDMRAALMGLFYHIVATSLATKRTFNKQLGSITSDIRAGYWSMTAEAVSQLRRVSPIDMYYMLRSNLLSYVSKTGRQRLVLVLKKITELLEVG